MWGGGRVQYLPYELRILKAQVGNKTKFKNLKNNTCHADELVV